MAPRTAEQTLYRAALLSGLGKEARALSDRVGAAMRGGRAEGMSCLEAGAPLQFTIDAPGKTALRVGYRVAGRPGDEARKTLPPGVREVVERAVRTLGPPRHALRDSLGTWVFESEAGRCVHLDVRDGSPQVALDRLRPLLDREGVVRLEACSFLLDYGHPWNLHLAVDSGEAPALLWLLDRRTDLGRVAERLGPPEAWVAIRDFLRTLLRGAPELRPGRWVVQVPLGAQPPCLRLATTAWAYLEEDQRKQAELGQRVAELGGPRDPAEALFSLCRGTAGRRWRVGRAVHVLAGEGGLQRVRFHLVPDVE